MDEDLKTACYELAKESFEWMKLKKESMKRGVVLTDVELDEKTQKGAWKKYLKANGDRGMINKTLSKEDDFGGQYEKMCKEAGL